MAIAGADARPAHAMTAGRVRGAGAIAAGAAARLPAWVCRVVYRVGFPMAVLWWRIRRSRHAGALAAIRVGEALLLVRATYRRVWTLPGGGVDRDEAPEAAMRREVREELGLDLDAVGARVGPPCVVCGRWDGRRDRVHVFPIRVDRLPPLRLDRREIVAARLFDAAGLASLPRTGPLAAYLAASCRNTSAIRSTAASDSSG